MEIKEKKKKRKVRARYSCSVYGTGRIHCATPRSVNYHRAINRAEKDPRALRGRHRRRLARFGTSTFLLLSVAFEQLCVVPIWEKVERAAPGLGTDEHRCWGGGFSRVGGAGSEGCCRGWESGNHPEIAGVMEGCPTDPIWGCHWGGCPSQCGVPARGGILARPCPPWWPSRAGWDKPPLLVPSWIHGGGISPWLSQASSRGESAEAAYGAFWLDG